MDLIKTLNTSKIKRRNFFLALGVSALGIFSISKLPLRLFTSKITGKIRNSGKIRITPNPMAVSRDKEGRDNG
jgi:hypothetical protein